MTPAELTTAFDELWTQADALHYKLKTHVRSLEEHDEGDDVYYVYVSLAERMDHIAGRIQDAEIVAELLAKLPGVASGN